MAGSLLASESPESQEREVGTPGGEKPSDVHHHQGARIDLVPSAGLGSFELCSSTETAAVQRPQTTDVDVTPRNAKFLYEIGHSQR